MKWTIVWNFEIVKVNFENNAVVEKEVALLEEIEECGAKVEQDAAILKNLEDSDADYEEKAAVLDDLKVNGVKLVQMVAALQGLENGANDYFLPNPIYWKN